VRVPRSKFVPESISGCDGEIYSKAPGDIL
jgi:hypothetical protein